MKRIIILFSATIAAASFGQSALNNPEGMIWDNYLDGIPALDVPAEADGHLTRWEVSEDGFNTSLISSSLTESSLINAVGLATNAAQRSELDAYATTNALQTALVQIEAFMATLYSGLMTFEEEITPVLSSHSDTLAELGSAAFVDVESFATAEQGTLAENALQRSELAAYATTNALADYATTTELQTAFAHAEEVMTTIYSGLMTFEEEITPVLSSHSDTLAELGSAAFVDVESFATAEQGTLAENALQVTGGTLRGDLDCGFNSITNVTAIGTDEETLASYNNVDERWTVNAEHIVADGEMTLSSSVGVITCAGQTFKALDDVELTAERS